MRLSYLQRRLLERLNSGWKLSPPSAFGQVIKGPDGIVRAVHGRTILSLRDRDLITCYPYRLTEEGKRAVIGSLAFNIGENG